MSRARVAGRFALALAAALAFTGCTTAPDALPAPTATATMTPTATPSPTVDDEPTISRVLVVGLDGLELVADDEIVGAVAYADGAGTLAFLAGLLGSTPEGEASPLGFPTTSYDWGGDVSLSVVDGGPANGFSTSVAIWGDIAIATREGIMVGSPITEVLALGAIETGVDANGDGTPDMYGLEAREEPGTVSLEDPSKVGTSWIGVVVEDGTVARILVPANDWGDL